MKPQAPVTRGHSQCGCICPPASLWDHALLERDIPSGVLTCQRADHALIHTARCYQPSLVSFQGSRCSGEGGLHLDVAGQMKTATGLLKAEGCNLSKAQKSQGVPSFPSSLLFRALLLVRPTTSSWEPMAFLCLSQQHQCKSLALSQKHSSIYLPKPFSLSEALTSLSLPPLRDSI